MKMMNQKLLVLWIVTGHIVTWMVTGHIVSFDRQKAVQIILSKCGPRQLCDPRKFDSDHTPVPDSDYCTVCGQCYCDSLCEKLGDCCLDVEVGLTDPTTIEPHDGSFVCIGEKAFDVDYLWNKSNSKQKNCFNCKIRSVSSCLADEEIAPDLIDKCERVQLDDFYSIVIVISTKTHLSYPNKYCAFCNKDFDVIQWRYRLNCDNYTALNMVRSKAEFVREMRTAKCELFFRLPKGVNSRDCHLTRSFYTKCAHDAESVGYDPLIRVVCEDNALGYITRKIFCTICSNKLDKARMIDTCQEEESGYIEQKVETGCENSSLVGVYGNGHLFKNIYCFWCSIESKHRGTCAVDSVLVDEYFDLLFDFTKLISNINHNIDECDDGFYDSFKKVCRTVLCPTGRVLIDGQCQMLFQTTKGLRYVLNVQLHSHWDTPGDRPDCQIWNDIVITEMQTYIGTEAGNILKHPKTFPELVRYISFSVHTDHELQTSGTTEERNTYRSQIYLDMIFQEDKYLDRETAEIFLISLLHREYSMYIGNGTLVNMTSFPSKRRQPLNPINIAGETCTLAFNSEIDYPASSQRVSYLLQCPQIKLTSDDFIREDGNIIIHGVRQVDVSYYDILNDGIVLICLNAYKLIPVPTSYIDVILTYSTLVISVVSSFCLLVSFVTYCLFEELRTLPGKNNMVLIFNLFLTVVLYQTLVRVKASGGLCLTLGITLHYFWLCLFTSMNVCCYHGYQVFSRKLLVSRDQDQNRNTSRYYVIYTFGSPMLVVSTTIAVNFGLDHLPDVVYAGEYCFLNSVYSLGVAFVAPILIVLLSNLVFFIATLHGLSKSPRIPGRDSGYHRRLCLVYLKLYTITGITWVLQVVNSFVTIRVLSYTANMLNAAQGVFIFLSFTCNQRVVRLYRNYRSASAAPEVGGQLSSPDTIGKPDDTSDTPM